MVVQKNRNYARKYETMFVNDDINNRVNQIERGYYSIVQRTFRISRQIRPNRSILGWYIFVRKRTLGGPMGYSPGRNNSNRNSPPESGLFGEDSSVRV